MLLCFEMQLADEEGNERLVYMQTDKFESPLPDRLSLEEILVEGISQGLLTFETALTVHEVNEIPLATYNNKTR